MIKKIILFILIGVTAIVPSSIIGNEVALTGKRYFNISYGISQHENLKKDISIGRLTINVPITRKLDLGFGSFQGWINNNNKDSTNTNQHDYSFFTHIKYHFLPKSIINPFILTEMGQIISHIKVENTSESNSEEIKSKSILLPNNKNNPDNSLTAINYYYSIGLGEEFTIKDKIAFTMYYNIGSMNNSIGYQQFVASIGYWLLRDLVIDLRFKSHINTPINEFHIISNIRF